MIGKKQIYILLAGALLLAGCTHDEVEYVSFDGEPLFTPYAQEVIDLSEEVPSVPALGSLRVEAGEAEDAEGAEGAAPQAPAHRTTSVSSTQLIKELLSGTHSQKIHSISGTYTSVDQTGATITLSGKVMLPAQGEIKNIILVSHYTIGANHEAPSESFQLEGLLAPMGYAMVFADYIGFGMTRELPHPYLCAHLTAQNVVDMLEAVAPYLERIGRAPKSKEIYLLGYSQGGATTIAVQRLLETNPRYERYPVRRNFAGAGPYDIASTYDAAIEADKVGIPCAIPMIIQGMNVGEQLGLDYTEFFKEPLLSHLDEWINSKRYTVSEIATLMNGDHLSAFLTDGAREKRSTKTAALYLAMLHNSLVVEDGWTPRAAIYMFHSQDDNVVPFLNSQRAKSRFASANVEYNFGHYGTHVMGAVRFIGCVKKLLESETDIDD